jgi:hypothetical protein
VGFASIRKGKCWFLTDALTAMRLTKADPLVRWKDFCFETIDYVSLSFLSKGEVIYERLRCRVGFGVPFLVRFNVGSLIF